MARVNDPQGFGYYPNPEPPQYPSPYGKGENEDQGPLVYNSYTPGLVDAHTSVESTMGSVTAMTVIVFFLAIILLLVMLGSTRKNFRKYCDPRKRTVYGVPEWSDGRRVYEQ
jgi:hypothetical protein